MRKIFVVPLLLLSFFCSCSNAPIINPEMKKHMSQTENPPARIEYTKVVRVYKSGFPIPWEKIPESHIATTTVSEDLPDAGVGIPLTVQSATDGKKLYFRVSWKDGSPHRSDDWDKSEKLAFNWNVRSRRFNSTGCAIACHLFPGKASHGQMSGMWMPSAKDLADNWIWIATKSGMGKIAHRKLTGSPKIVERTMPDMGKMVMASGGMMQAHKMKLGYLDDPAPSSLAADSRYGDGGWTVIISRPLTTADASEAQFDLSKKSVYVFGISVFPGRMFHDYSGVLSLEFR